MCDCGALPSDFVDYRGTPKVKSRIIDKWIVDHIGRTLLISSPIYDTYNDIIGYVTKDTNGNVVRIFEKNIQKILD
jgi:hypothetical protein